MAAACSCGPLISSPRKEWLPERPLIGFTGLYFVCMRGSQPFTGARRVEYLGGQLPQELGARERHAGQTVPHGAFLTLSV